MKSHRRTRAEGRWVAVPGKKAAGPLSQQGAETPAWGSGDRPCNEGAHDLSGGLGPSGERALSLTVSLRLCRRQPSGAGVTVPPPPRSSCGGRGLPRASPRPQLARGRHARRGVGLRRPTAGAPGNLRAKGQAGIHGAGPRPPARRHSGPSQERTRREHAGVAGARACFKKVVLVIIFI